LRAPASYTPLNTFLICITVTTPVAWFTQRQKFLLEKVREDLARARDEAAAANAAKSAFLAAMSHEIRTPLNGVLGMSQAMAAGELSTIQRQRIDVISRSGEALLGVLNDLLDLSRIEAGRLDLDVAEFDLGRIAGEVRETFGAVAEKKGLSFSVDLGEAEGAYLGDGARLRQILFNLASNALKFTESGGVAITARTGEKGLSITVEDTGVGIPPKNLARLFTAFEQVEGGYGRAGGSGLGLAICRKLARLMGGDVTVESVVGVGSTFTVDIPLQRVAAGAAPLDARMRA
jgi:signal transduction histidine kinase